MMMMNNHNSQSDFSEKMQKCQDYIQALEEERCKIQVFQRELPLCLELVTQAIETCKHQLSGTTTEYNSNGQSECSEQTSSDVPVFEEFIPMKRASSHSDDGEEQDSKKSRNDTGSVSGKDGKNDKNSKKSDWLRSVQLWNQTPDPPSKEDSPRRVAVTEVKRSGSGGAFHPFKKEESVNTPATPPAQVQPASTSSTAGSGGGNKKEGKEGESHRKSRRCWSPELHKRFLQALQQLGGSHVATPKQIRELMKVDGLTNDEVKSHLQKYRLHTRRPTHSLQNNNNNNNTQTPQFVVVGGIWVPPEYATTAMSGEVSVHAPVAARPPSNKIQETSSPSPSSSPPPSPTQIQHKQSDDLNEESHSPATSHTTTY